MMSEIKNKRTFGKRVVFIYDEQIQLKQIELSMSLLNFHCSLS